MSATTSLFIKYFFLSSKYYLPLKLHSYSLILIISVFCVRLFAEDYRIYLLGIPIVNVTMESTTNTLSFHTETLGLIYSIWPVNNHYFTEYDSISFGIRKYTKLINQGRYNGELNAYYDLTNSQLKYNDESVFVMDSVQNIFTLLAREYNFQ